MISKKWSLGGLFLLKILIFPFFMLHLKSECHYLPKKNKMTRTGAFKHDITKMVPKGNIYLYMIWAIKRHIY